MLTPIFGTFTLTSWLLSYKINTILIVDPKERSSIDKAIDDLKSICKNFTIDQKGISNFHLFMYNASIFFLSLPGIASKISSTSFIYDTTIGLSQKKRSLVGQCEIIVDLFEQQSYFEIVCQTIGFYFPDNSIKSLISNNGDAKGLSILGKNFEWSEIGLKMLLGMIQICYKKNWLMKSGNAILFEAYSRIRDSKSQEQLLFFSKHQNNFKVLFAIYFLNSGKTQNALKILQEVNLQDC
jgi:hypothetical protein